MAAMSYRRRDTYTAALNKARKEQADAAKTSNTADENPNAVPAVVRGPVAAYIPRKHVPVTRPILTDAEKAEATARAKAALRAEKVDLDRERATQHKYAYCEMCGEPATKRTLCNNHYQLALRVGELEAYPTKAFLDRPRDHAIWLFDYFPEIFDDMLAQRGLKLTPLEP
jgi:RNA polymerase-binding transcription factor DksA